MRRFFALLTTVAALSLMACEGAADDAETAPVEPAALPAEG